MHEYSIRGFSRTKIIFLLSEVAVIVAPVISSLLHPLFNKLSTFVKIPQIAAFSVSGALVFTILWFCFCRFFWKLPFMTKVLNVPNLSGTWNCHGEGHKYNNSTELNRWDGEITIEQSLEKMIIITKTQKSTSHSTSVIGDLECKGDKEFILTYMYENEPFINEEGLHKHTGFCRLTFDIKKGTANGTYYTDADRGSFGNMKLTRGE
jgi:hypothetical protein